MDRYPRWSPDLNKFPASQLRGLSASGCAKRAITARQTDCNVHAGLQAVFNISKQISPVLKWTLGWKILVTKRTWGGTRGYCSGTLTASWNTPSWYGVSTGPCNSFINQKPSASKRKLADVNSQELLHKNEEVLSEEINFSFDLFLIQQTVADPTKASKEIFKKCYIKS